MLIRNCARLNRQTGLFFDNQDRSLLPDDVIARHCRLLCLLGRQKDDYLVSSLNGLISAQSLPVDLDITPAQRLVHGCTAQAGVSLQDNPHQAFLVFLRLHSKLQGSGN
jgi:hypothetical protein